MARDTSDDHLLLHALADDELDAATTLRLEHRVKDEPALVAEYERILAIKRAVTRLARPAVSDDFTARIEGLAASRSPTGRTRMWSWPTADWRAIAASLVMTACLSSVVTYSITAPRDARSMDDEIVNGHRRSLLATSPIDIGSSDRHTVRPWFDTKLGLSPPTPDLSALGYTLVGGRVDVIAGRPVPSLVYKHKEHLITVVAMPAATDTARDPIESTKGGYNMVHWSQTGFRYWAVSDLDKAELGDFVQAMRSK